MDINVPLKISVVGNPDASNWGLLAEFRENICQLDLQEHARTFLQYLSKLTAASAQLSKKDPAPTGLDVLQVQQLSEESLPHTGAGEPALHETVSLLLTQSETAASLQGLINSSTI